MNSLKIFRINASGRLHKVSRFFFEANEASRIILYVFHGGRSSRKRTLLLCMTSKGNCYKFDAEPCSAELRRKVEHLEALSERLGKPIIIKGKNNMNYMVRPDPPAIRRREHLQEDDEDFYRMPAELPPRYRDDPDDFEYRRRRRPTEELGSYSAGHGDAYHIEEAGRRQTPFDNPG